MDVAVEPRVDVRVELAHASTLNFSMDQAGVPVITFVRIVNRGASSVDGVDTGDGALAGYQTRSVERVRTMVGAPYATPHLVHRRAGELRELGAEGSPRGGDPP